MDVSEALAHLRDHRLGALVTLRSNGRPQLSNVAYSVGDDGLIRVSITAGRAKYKNLLRSALASLHVSRPDGWAYVVIDADAELTPVAQSTDDATVVELVDLYRALSGEHPDWDEYRRAMVDDRRVVLRLRPTHAYGMWPAA